MGCDGIASVRPLTLGVTADAGVPGLDSADASASCASTRSDPKNCGRCGRVCPTNCVDGACAPLVMATGHALSDLAVTDQELFFREQFQDAGLIEAMRKADDARNGSGPRTLDDAGTFIARAGNTVYWAEDTVDPTTTHVRACPPGCDVASLADMPVQ